MIDEILARKAAFIKTFKLTPSKIHMTKHQIKELNSEFKEMYSVYKTDNLKGVAEIIATSVYGLKIVECETDMHLTI